MFLVDKYEVKNIDDIILHKSIYDKLIVGSSLTNRQKNLAELKQIIESKSYDKFDKFHLSKPTIYDTYQQMPNLLIHGPPGCGKHTLIKLLLTDIFNDTVNDTFMETYLIKGYGNTVISVNIEKSNYHLIIEPNNTGLDKYLIQEIAKEYAKQKFTNMTYVKYPFRIVLINNIDNLNSYAQASLRCTMEKYYKTCRFILCGNNTSKISEPIKSRCLNIRMPAPTKNELTDLIFHILLSEKKLLKKSTICDIIKMGNFNIKTTLWILEMHLYKIKDFELSWKNSLKDLTKLMAEFKNDKIKILNDKLIPKTREILYNAFTTNIPGIEILHELVQTIILSELFDNQLLNIIIQISSEIESRLNKGKRFIIHLDCFMCKVYQQIYLHYHRV